MVIKSFPPNEPTALNTAGFDSSNNLKKNSFIQSIKQIRNLATFKSFIVNLFSINKKAVEVPKIEHIKPDNTFKVSCS